MYSNRNNKISNFYSIAKKIDNNEYVSIKEMKEYQDYLVRQFNKKTTKGTGNGRN